MDRVSGSVSKFNLSPEGMEDESCNYSNARLTASEPRDCRATASRYLLVKCKRVCRSERFARMSLRRSDNCASTFAVLRGLYSLAVHTRIHARGHAGTRVADRPQSRTREVHRVNARRGASVDRHPSCPTVRSPSLPERRRRDIHLPVSECVYSLPRVRASAPRYDSVERDFLVRESRKIDRGVRVAVHLNLPHPLLFPSVLTSASYHESPSSLRSPPLSLKTAEPQRQTLSSIAINRFQPK